MHINIAKVDFKSISKSIGINIAKVDFGLYDVAKPRLDGLYITPAGSSAISVTPNSNYYSLHGKYLKYSFDGKGWKDWDGAVAIQPGQKMYVNGEDNYVWTKLKNGKLITADGNYNVGGDISSLTNYIDSVKDCTFRGLFNADSYIKDAGNLILPATKLAEYCYSKMFYNCTALTTAPALPATTLAPNCYNNMFYKCTSLKTAPALPATTLTNYCYSNMFSGCRLLTAAPELPATTLATSCYYSMFEKCGKLTTAPALPATTLATNCYSYMFDGCSSLATAPALPATTLAERCYNGMFYNCWKLTTAPSLPATELTIYCYQYMFAGCGALTTSPELRATTLVASCYSNMFLSCSKIDNITMLATDISAASCLENWVNGVAATGTFTKAAAVTLPSGVNGIPTGWTVVDYTAA